MKRVGKSNRSVRRRCDESSAEQLNEEEKRHATYLRATPETGER